MQYVKLIAKPDTWFKAGTEIYSYDCSRENPKRISLLEWNIMEEDGLFCGRGIRVKELHSEAPSIAMGEEYFDGECGSPDECDVEITDKES